MINALSDASHPCQAMADLMTIVELKGTAEGKKVVFVGDGNNVARSLACALGPDGRPNSCCPPRPATSSRRISGPGSTAGSPAIPLRVDRDPAIGGHRRGRGLYRRLGEHGPGARGRTEASVFEPYRSTTSCSPAPGRTRSSSIACPPTAARRSPRACSTDPAARSSSRRPTGSIFRWRCWSGSWKRTTRRTGRVGRISSPPFSRPAPPSSALGGDHSYDTARRTQSRSAPAHHDRAQLSPQQSRQRAVSGRGYGRARDGPHLRDGPPFLEGKGVGWLTAEYAMLPGSTPTRTRRGADGRATEIQRLIGRSLRAVIDRKALGPVTVNVDTDVLNADGGTRTASITAAFVAIADALRRHRGDSCTSIFRDSIAAVSAGIVGGVPVLDLDYPEDSTAEVNINVVRLGRGGLVEVQGTGEGGTFSRGQLDQLLNLAEAGIDHLTMLQRECLGPDWPLAE